MKSSKSYNRKSMPTSPLKKALLSYYASIEDRQKGVKLIIDKPELLEELISLAFSKEQNREHIIASWVFEMLITKTQYITLNPYFSDFLLAYPHQKHESKRRPFAKLLYQYCDVKKNREQLSKTQIDTIVTLCFDTLLEAKKVAPKAYVIKTLAYFKNHESWILPELKSYIEKEIPNSTAAFKSVVKQLLIF